MKIVTWNVNGIRSRIFNRKTSAKIAKETEIIPEEGSPIANIIKIDPDFVGLQETRCSLDNGAKFKILGYNAVFNESKNTGAREANRYSGTCIFYKNSYVPESVEFQIPGYQDDEGRIIVLKFSNFTIINVYTPNSGTNFEKRLSWQQAFLQFLKSLENKVYFIGDMNVAWRDDDVHFRIPTSPTFKSNNYDNIIGFLKEEREFIPELITCGFSDSYCFTEKQYGPMDGFTYWDNRSKKIEGLPGARYTKHGWRIDYCFVKNDTIKHCYAMYSIGTEYIIHGDSQASDHCPVFLEN